MSDIFEIPIPKGLAGWQDAQQILWMFPGQVTIYPGDDVNYITRTPEAPYADLKEIRRTFEKLAQRSEEERKKGFARAQRENKRREALLEKGLHWEDCH